MIKINQDIINFTKVFIGINFCLVIYSFSSENMYWLINAQVAFFSSLFITIVSFLSYKKNIQDRILNLDISQTSKIENRDKIDEIDDPYDLYTEYEKIQEKELTPEKIKKIINDEKSKVRRNSFKNTLFSVGGFLSIYRILAYASLLFAFFALNNNGIFSPIAFMVGLGVVPLGVLISKLLYKKL